jgi:hypothetical protein
MFAATAVRYLLLLLLALRIRWKDEEKVHCVRMPLLYRSTVHRLHFHGFILDAFAYFGPYFTVVTTIAFSQVGPLPTIVDQG